MFVYWSNVQENNFSGMQKCYMFECVPLDSTRVCNSNVGAHTGEGESVAFKPLFFRSFRSYIYVYAISDK